MCICVYMYVYIYIYYRETEMSPYPKKSVTLCFRAIFWGCFSGCFMAAGIPSSAGCSPASWS